MRKRFLFFLLSFLIIQLGSAQSPEVLLIRKYATENAGSIINEFSELLSLPNVAADPDGQQKTAAFIMTMMNKRGIQKVQLLNASTPGVPPAVYGEVIVPGAKQTLIFMRITTVNLLIPLNGQKNLIRLSQNYFQMPSIEVDAIFRFLRTAAIKTNGGSMPAVLLMTRPAWMPF
jgi:hypothetical protein